MTEKTNKEVQRVLKVFNMDIYQKYLYGELTYGDFLSKYQCTNHVMLIVFKQLQLVSRTQFLKSTTNNLIFDVINSAETAYILGFYIADGSISGNRLSFSLSEKDLDLLIQIKNYISPNAKIQHYPEKINKQGIKSNAMCSLSITSEHICKTLENYGIGYRKTYKIKSIANIIPKQFMWDFIRGYFDGDGCVSASNIKKVIKDKEYHHTNVCWTIISKDKLILEEIQSFINSEGCTKILVYPDKKGNFLMGTHSLKNLKIIFSKLYNNTSIKLDRKYKKFQNIIANTEVSSEIAKGSETP